MKLLEKIRKYTNKPFKFGQAFQSNSFVWIVTCVLSRQEPFGVMYTEPTYEITAADASEALNSARSYVKQSRPEYSIESMKISRQPTH